MVCHRIQIIGEWWDDGYRTMHASKGGRQRRVLLQWGKNRKVWEGIGIKDLDGRRGEDGGFADLWKDASEEFEAMSRPSFGFGEPA